MAKKKKYKIKNQKSKKVTETDDVVIIDSPDSGPKFVKPDNLKGKKAKEYIVKKQDEDFEPEEYEPPEDEVTGPII
jgi:hypothetical protein